jgi:FixJ family two-component response regulator
MLNTQRAGITEREFETFRRACRGASNVEIARAMHVGTQTVKNRLSIVYCKLAESGVGQRVGNPRVYFAYMMGLSDGIKYAEGRGKPQ